MDRNTDIINMPPPPRGSGKEYEDSIGKGTPTAKTPGEGPDSGNHNEYRPAPAPKMPLGGFKS